MVFNSTIFLLFFLVFFNTYWFINGRFSTKVRNAFILLSSYVFYGYWDWRFLGLLLISSLGDFLLGLQMAKHKEPAQKKKYLYFSLLLNLCILGSFKYFNFFIDSFLQVLSLFSLNPDPFVLQIILPVGISFYTFQTLSYTIDIYRGTCTPTKDPIQFFAFVSFFPQLVAGPIERAQHLLGQFAEKKEFEYNACIRGLRLILWGFFKKIVIADNLGPIVDQIFLPGAHTSSALIFVGAILFSFQIYCDFSGYSDIAIGLARMLGFDLRKNFQTPYFSSSFTEFWRRWHISLSTWFRDYVYIPLGGSRGTKLKTSYAIFLTFVLSGLWHGAEFTFLIWGAFHGLLLIAEKRISLKLPRIPAIIVVFLVCSMLWIPFRAIDSKHFFDLTQTLFSFSEGFHEFSLPFLAVHSIEKLGVLAFVMSFFLIGEYRMGMKSFEEWLTEKGTVVRISTYYVLLLAILLLGNFDVEPYFIYFQF